MKRLIVLLLALLLALPAFAEQTDFTPYDYQIMHTADGHSVVYAFPDITLIIPINWETAATVEQSENGIAFYQTASLEKYREQGLEGGGFLCELCASEDEDFRELPAYRYLGYSESAGLHFYLVVPSDYPAYMEDEAIRAEYDEMHGQIDSIVEKAQIKKNSHFYPEIIEGWTDSGRS